ncbi:amidohydrolase [Amorphus sp. 3PC139-8]|uniref:amidohydrolase n=1 Tax=Amorphus sp. 3PC139-8 TaxID=2735676 RepID=UPI00345C98E0
MAFRHELHRHPELSGEEAETAQRVCAMLNALSPDRVVTGLGGHGVAAVFDSGLPGPSILFRSELDALPIQELGAIEHRSTVPGKAHLCGHDGHSTILLGLGRVLARKRPERGRVILMFQPAEEDGTGAAAVISDPRFEGLQPDWAFSLHNAPDVPLGTARLGAGPANCASRGMWIRLTGSTAHASRPADGVSPMRAISELMPMLESLGSGLPLGTGFSMVTLTHASMGAAAYGVAPGEALVLATLRTVADEEMKDLMARAETCVTQVAEAHGLALACGYDDIFLASVNDAEATAILQDGILRAGVCHLPQEVPSVGSEDFGRFGRAGAKSAMLFLGAGPDCPAVHTPEYDFRDALIPTGVRIFSEALASCLERYPATSEAFSGDVEARSPRASASER